MDFETLRTTVVEFVRLHEGWAPFIVAALAFGESLAFISLFVPATFILVGIGALIGTAGLEFGPIWLGAMLGAALGDWLSYTIGRTCKDRVLTLWPMSRYPEAVARGERFILRFGPWALFIGRFFGPVRAVVPLIAGIFSVPAVLFHAANWSSASVWAFVLLAPGAGLMAYLGR